MTTHFSTDDRQSIQSIAASMKHLPGALLPVLHAVQTQFGFVPPESVPIIADELNLSRAEVHGVISYYHHFRDHPPGRHVVQVCRAESCQAMGAETLAAYVEQKTGCKFHGTSADHEFSLENVYCLGLCAQSPAIMIDDQLHAHVTPQRLDALLANLKESS